MKTIVSPFCNILQHRYSFYGETHENHFCHHILEDLEFLCQSIEMTLSLHNARRIAHVSCYSNHPVLLLNHYQTRECFSKSQIHILQDSCSLPLFLLPKNKCSRQDGEGYSVQGRREVEKRKGRSERSYAPLASKDPPLTGGTILIITPRVRGRYLAAKGAELRSLLPSTTDGVDA